MALDADPLMRHETRGSPSWPGFDPETGYVDADCSDLIAETPCRRGGRAIRFKYRLGAIILGMMARPRRELAEPQGAQLLAQRLFRNREPELLPVQRGALDFPEKRAAPRRLAVHLPFRTLGIEPKHLVAHRLEPDPADRRSFPPRASVINRRQGQ